ncbi:MAG: rplI [Acidimicrobiales bacterium]|nr:rplI [Acidimicrobiales bacterium]
MRVILRSDVAGVGNKGDVVDVAAGYGRNFLLPRGLALMSSKGAEAQAGGMRRSRDQKDAVARSAAEEVATRLVAKPIVLTARVGVEGKLFGSVTTHDIADAVEAQTGVSLDRRQLHLEEPIRSVGTHTVPAKLHADVEFPITVEVVGGD